ncbi:MAG TPA: GNAT family N-acetyltransferase [Blastocatellia bacterium]|jgi:ribosomal protein S18 acetylase RimI-like enzyme|nr:GNAT family N-acetyltransferase [Blastocatellia bacterium]
MKEEFQNRAHSAATPLSLRPVRREDEEFLLEVYASARAEELSQTGWDEAQKRAFLRMQFAAQQQHYQSRFPNGDHRLIIRDGRPAGRIYTAGTDQEIRILDLTLLAQHRNAGVGTALLKDILADAEDSRRTVRIYVESFNPSLRLFERLGFSCVETSGLNRLMEWRPKAQRASAEL